MITQKPMRTTANEGIISGGKTSTTRTCESCLKSRARWFCPADDAFLCHSCDSSVHSTNDLAARHNRVPLQTLSFHKPTNYIVDDDDVITTTPTTTPANQPTWHQGFQKKARTPRHHHPKKEHMKKKTKKKMMMNMMMVVPEMSGDEEEEEEHMVFSVPTFDPFDHHHHEEDISNLFGFEGIINDHDHDHQKPSYWDSLLVFDDHDHGHVERLLLEGTDEDQVVYSSSSAVPCLITANRETGSERPPVSRGGGGEEGVVKVEEEEDGIESSTCEDEFDFWAMELENEVLMNNNNNLEVGKGNCCGGKNEEGEKKEGVERELMEEEEGNYVEMEGNKNKKRKIFLRLNYEEVINSWFGSSPWTTGCRPEFDLDRDGWPNSMGGMDPMDAHYQGWGVIGERKYTNGGDDGREARVSRYREKRRTRLFSKKIRYEVRKLNAEKRPRLKGRFVKRTSPTPALGFGPNFSYMNK